MWTQEQGDELYEKILRLLEEDEADYPRCFMCGWRCDPPHGNGVRCLVCTAKPTGLDMAQIIN